MTTFKQTLRGRILTIVLSFLLTIGIGYSIFNYINNEKQIIKTAAASIRIFNDIFTNEIITSGKSLSMSMEMILKNQEIISAFAAGNRNKLASLTVDLFNEVLKPTYGIAQFQFHTPPATSFFRVHKPQKYGDDLSSFRKTVVAANTELKPIIGLEVGRAGPGLRVVYPAYFDGKHIGSIEFGASINSILTTAKKTTDTEYAIGIKADVFRAARRFKNKKTDVVQAGTIFYAFSTTKIHDLIAQMDIFDSDEMIKTGSNYFYKDLIPLKDYSGKTIGNILVLKNITDLVSHNKKNAVLTGMVVVFAAFVISFMLFVLLQRSVIIPLNKLSYHMANADFTDEIQIDVVGELKELMDKFNNLRRKFTSYFSKTSDDITYLSEKVNNLYDAAENMNSLAQKQRSQIEQIATSSVQMSQTILDMAQNASEVSSATKESSERAEQGKNIVDKSVSSIEALADKVSIAARSMEELGKSSEEIGEILSVIQDIADQTNLLALNAAIEAARAGDQGRGFAVVADEVRKLAEKTADATMEINEKITAIQTEVKQSIGIMVESKSMVKETVEMAQQASEALKQIVSSSNAVMDMVQNIASATEEQSAASQEISQGMEQISVGIEKTAEIIEQVNNAAREISELATSLAESISVFKAGDNA